MPPNQPYDSWRLDNAEPNDPVLCPRCNGMGAFNEYVECSLCSGSGEIDIHLAESIKRAADAERNDLD